MKSMYEIADDYKAIYSLVGSLEDEDGNPREPTDKEKEILAEWFGETEENFEKKFDGYNKFIQNLKESASVCEAERKSFKDEMDRLSKRAKTALNKVEVLKNNLRFCMERIGIKNYKSQLFSANIQNVGGKTFSALEGADLSGIPERFLKPRELDVSAVKEAIKSGELVLRENDANPLNRSKVFFAKDGRELSNVRWSQPTAIVLR